MLIFSYLKGAFGPYTLSAGSDSEQAFGVATYGGSYNGVYLVGRTGFSPHRPTIVKTFKDEVQWGKMLVTSENADYKAVAVDSSNNPYAVGEVFVSGSGMKMVIVKYNGSTGDILFQRELNTVADDTGNGIVFDTSGNYYVSGRSNYDGIVVKYNSSDVEQWVRNYDVGTVTDTRGGICIDSSNNLYHGIRARYTSYYSMSIIKREPTSGTVQWERNLASGSSNVYINGIHCNASGRVAIVGEIQTDNDAIVASYDSSGNIQWQTEFGDAGNDDFEDCYVDASNDVYVTGHENSSGVGGDNSWVLKLDGTNGQPLWRKIIRQNSSDRQNAITVDETNGVLVSAGNAFISGDDLMMLKMSTGSGLSNGTYGVYTVLDDTTSWSAASLTDSAGSGSDAAGTPTTTTPTYANNPYNPTMTQS